VVGGPRLEELDGALATPPGFDSDLIVHADPELFDRPGLGHIEYDTAARCGSLVVDEPRGHAKPLPVASD